MKTRTRPVRPSQRSAIGRLMVAARTRCGLSLRALARVLGMAPSHVSNVERGRVLPSAEMVGAMLAALAVPESEGDRWYAAAEMLAPGMLERLLAHPEQWRAVRALLSADGMTVTGNIKATVTHSDQTRPCYWCGSGADLGCLTIGVLAIRACPAHGPLRDTLASEVTALLHSALAAGREVALAELRGEDDRG